MPNPYVLRFAVMEKGWDFWHATTETHSQMMVAALPAILTMAFNAVEAQYLLLILAVKFVVMGESWIQGQTVLTVMMEIQSQAMAVHLTVWLKKVISALVLPHLQKILVVNFAEMESE
jgi:hypothetical protein